MGRNPQSEMAGPKHLGRWMIVGAWVLGLLLLVLLFQGVLDRQRNPNAQPLSRTDAGGNPEVVLLRNRAGHYVAGGRVNGEPVTFLLDTGATEVAVSRALAEELGLERLAPVSTQTANGRVRAWRTRLDRVDLGSISLGGVRAVILPSLPRGEVLLGMSFLKRLELVQRGDKLTLRPYDA